MDSASETVNNPQLDAFYYKVALVAVSLHSSGIGTETIEEIEECLPWKLRDVALPPELTF